MWNNPLFRPRLLALLILIIVLPACSEKTPQSEVISSNGIDIRYNYYPVIPHESDSVTLVEDVMYIDEERAGFSPDEFIASTSDVTVGANREIFLLDGRLRCVFIFNQDGQFIKSFGRQGSGPGELDSPYHFGTIDRNQIIISESMLSRAYIFDLTGEFLKQLSLPVPRVRCLTSDNEGGYFVAVRALQRRPGESGAVNGTTLYRLNSDGQIIPFELSVGEQDTLEIARYVATGDERFFHSISNRKNLFSTPDGRALIAGLDYTFFNVSKNGRMSGFRRVSDPYKYPDWYVRERMNNWIERGSPGDPPGPEGFHIEPGSMAVDERGHLWVLPMDGWHWDRATSMQDNRRDGIFSLDEFSSDGQWLRQLHLELPPPCAGFVLMDAAHGYLYGITFIGDPAEEISAPVRFRRP